MLVMLQPFPARHQLPLLILGAMPIFDMKMDEEPRSKRLGVGVDPILESGVKKMVEKWSTPNSGEKGDKTLLDVMAKEIVDLQYRMGEVEHAAMYAWELPSDHLVAQMAAQWHQKWDEKRTGVTQEMKDRRDGSANIGHIKNYMFMSIVNAYLSSVKEDDAGHQKLYKEIAALIGDGEGNIVEGKVKSLDKLVAACRIKTVEKAKKCFVTIMIRVEFREIQTLLYAWFDKEGTRQLDPPPLRKSTLELRKKTAKS